MAIKNAYFSTLASCRYIFKSGEEAPFINFVYYTDDAKQIEELETEIKKGHPHIYIKADKLKVDTSKLDPLETLKQTIRDQVMAEMAAATDKSNDRGTSAKVKLNVATSATVAELAAGSGT